MFRGMARKVAAAIIGAAGTWLVTFFTALGIGPEETASAISNIEFILTLLVFGAITFASEHALKFVKPLFPGDWADEIWRDEVGVVVAPVAKRVAESKIRDGAL